MKLLGAMPQVNLNLSEVKALRAAVVFWVGQNQEVGDRLSLQAARYFMRRLDAVTRDLTGKDPTLTWRVTGLEARTLNVVRAALSVFPQLDNISEKFQ